MTKKQTENYNKMLNTLKRIKQYESIEKLRKNSEKDYGIDYDEALEMAYENIQSEASECIKGIQSLKPTTKCQNKI